MGESAGPALRCRRQGQAVVSPLRQLGVDLRWIIVYWLIWRLIKLTPWTKSGRQLVDMLWLWMKMHELETRNEMARRKRT